MSEKGYNGYKNWETWNAVLVLTNEQDSADHMDEMAKPHREAYEVGESESEYWTPAQSAVFSFADELKDHFETVAEDALEILRRQEHALIRFLDGADAEFVRMLLPSLAYASVNSDIDWQEVARYFLGEEIAEQADKDAAR